MPPEADGWNEYQKLVLSELARLNKGIEALKGKVGEMAVEIAVLKTKASMWGALAGVGATVVIMLGRYLLG